MPSKPRGHPGLNRRPLDLQSNALPLSYIPIVLAQEMLKNFTIKSDVLLIILLINDVLKNSPGTVFVALVVQW